MFNYTTDYYKIIYCDIDISKLVAYFTIEEVMKDSVFHIPRRDILLTLYDGNILRVNECTCEIKYLSDLVD